eukprot:SAG31_NODE_2498_length_5598_cov_2.801600_2_plen_70_part_00
MSELLTKPCHTGMPTELSMLQLDYEIVDKFSKFISPRTGYGRTGTAVPVPYICVFSASWYLWIQVPGTS